MQKTAFKTQADSQDELLKNHQLDESASQKSKSGSVSQGSSKNLKKAEISHDDELGDDENFSEDDFLQQEIDTVSSKQPAFHNQNAKDPAALDMDAFAREVPIQVVAVAAKKTIPLKELLSLKKGSVVDFSKNINEQIDLVANGKLVARGELVLVEGRVGIHIKETFH